MCGYLENQIGRIHFQGIEKQLRLDATNISGETKQFLSLMDTRAQVQLFCSRLFHACDTTDAQKIISLVTVDGTRLGGGDRKIELLLTLWASTEKGE